jgi:hypothetical protein
MEAMEKLVFSCHTPYMTLSEEWLIEPRLQARGMSSYARAMSSA